MTLLGEVPKDTSFAEDIHTADALPFSRNKHFLQALSLKTLIPV